jgi:hypothetical protein
MELRAVRRGLLRNTPTVFALALTLRWAADLALNPYLDPVIVDGHDAIDQDILDGHGFSHQPGRSIPTVTRAPSYPLWRAAELAVLGRDFLLLRMAESLFDLSPSAAQ